MDENFENAYEELSDNEFLISKGVQVEYVNLQDSEGFPDIFYSSHQYQAIFYIQGQPIELLDFHEYFLHQESL